MTATVHSTEVEPGIRLLELDKDVRWGQLEIGSLAAGIALENSTQIATTFAADQAEAVVAFLKKRPAEFTDR